MAVSRLSRSTNEPLAKAEGFFNVEMLLASLINLVGMGAIVYFFVRSMDELLKDGDESRDYASRLEEAHRMHLEHIRDLEDKALSYSISQSPDEYRETLAVHKRSPNSIQQVGDMDEMEISTLGDLPNEALEDVSLKVEDGNG